MHVDVFRALAAVAWADGRIDPAEAESLLRAARASGLSGDDLARVKRATETRVSLDDLGPLSLQGEEAEYAYALAWLVSAADGRVDREERDVVRALGDRLGLSAEDRERAQTASAALAETLATGTGVLRALADAATTT